MRHVTRQRMVGAVAVLLAVIVGGVLLVWNPEQPYDRGFDSRVTDPAYPAAGPVVLYDEGHRNTHTASAGYRPLADPLRNDGYTLRVSREPFTPPALEGVTVLVLVLAQGANDANDAPAYAEAEGTSG